MDVAADSKKIEKGGYRTGIKVLIPKSEMKIDIKDDKD